MQRRGVFIDAEDFLPITATYPEHPLSKVVPNFKAQHELFQQRRVSYRQDVEEKTAAYEKHKKVVMGEINRIPDEGYVASPKYTSVK
jgi:hypothetical protein